MSYGNNISTVYLLVAFCTRPRFYVSCGKFVFNFLSKNSPCPWREYSPAMNDVVYSVHSVSSVGARKMVWRIMSKNGTIILAEAGELFWIMGRSILRRNSFKLLLDVFLPSVMWECGLVQKFVIICATLQSSNSPLSLLIM